jgi:hypothetical protein
MTEGSRRKIEALKHCGAEDSWCHDCPAVVECINAEITTARKVAKMALEVIDELGRELEGYKDSLSDSVRVIVELQAQQPKWTPVTEGLPMVDEIVLVTARTKTGLHNINRAYWGGNIWHGSGSMANVTAWMPLPEPYEPKEDNHE